MTDQLQPTAARRWRPSRVDIIVAIVCSVASLAWFIAHTRDSAPRLDGHGVARDITATFDKRLTVLTGTPGRVHVTCPASPPMRSGTIFDCSMTGYPQALFAHVRVTEQDSHGHLQYQAY